jgi:hypothetical protein
MSGLLRASVRHKDTDDDECSQFVVVMGVHKETDGAFVIYEQQGYSSIAWRSEIVGNVKWDGCMHWIPPNGYGHFCSPEEVQHLTAALLVAYGLGAKFYNGEYLDVVPVPALHPTDAKYGADALTLVDLP